MSFTWTVDGITQGQQQNFTFDFLNANPRYTYTVGLNAQTQHGCQDDTSFTVTVYPDPIAQINQIASVIDCAPLTIDENLIEAQEYINNNDSYTWTFTLHCR